uniref:Uncharacterized protein n=1 Tax=Avena sativa TaxID=4498 RepID=A0ACD5T7V4_AVESA
MARLPTTTAAFFFIAAAAALFVAAAGTSVSAPHQDGGDNTAEYIFAQGRKVAAGTSVGVLQAQKSGANTNEYTFARKLAAATAGAGAGAAGTGGGAASVTQACDKLEGNKKVCYTISKLPGVTNPRTLLETAIRVGLSRAKGLKATFDAAKLAAKMGNPMASILGSCDKNYDDLVSALEEASRAVEKGKSGSDLVTKMSAASTYATDCDNWYQERNLVSPYEAVQRHAAQAVSVALGVAATSKNL